MIRPMKIADYLATGQKSFSFEFFPPKNELGFEQLFEAIEDLKRLSPTFVSVTYGAGGSTREKTVSLVKRIKHEIGIEPMAHLTCVGSTRDEIAAIVSELEAGGIENILALRGDPPTGEACFVPAAGGCRYANELVECIRELKREDEGEKICLGVAGYPEKHPEAADLATDMANLKRKVEAGGSFIITQLFFDNALYFDFVKRARAAGITVPIIPGIMPILNVKQLKRFTEMCGATIPPELLRSLEEVEGMPEAVRELGIAHATRQCRELLAGGAPGIHFYTLNRSLSTRRIFESLKSEGLIPA